jgi:hypothetical protein
MVYRTWKMPPFTLAGTTTVSGILTRNEKTVDILIGTETVSHFYIQKIFNKNRLVLWYSHGSDAMIFCLLVLLVSH